MIQNIYCNKQVKAVYLNEQKIYQNNEDISTNLIEFIPNETILEIGKNYIYEEAIGESLIEGATAPNFEYPYFGLF